LKKNTPFTWKPEKGKRQEESSFCEQKEAKKLHPLAAGSLSHRVSCEKSFLLLFFQKKKTLPAYHLPGFFGFSGKWSKAKKLLSHGVRQLVEPAPNG
jgi:hypothetical protein